MSEPKNIVQRFDEEVEGDQITVPKVADLKPPTSPLDKLADKAMKDLKERTKQDEKDSKTN